MTKHANGAWHREVITASTETSLKSIRETGALEPFYLAGGTGLALQFGHRLSQDLDFFANDLFDEESLLQRIQVLAGFSLVSRSPHTLHAVIKATKVTLLGYRYPLLFPFGEFQKVHVAEPRDIACMKLTAIASRGTKRDFVDFYACCQEYDISELLRLFEQKYQQTHYNKLHLLKSLTFFDDAEKDPMPHMLLSLDWNEVKTFFRVSAPKLL